MLFFFFNQGNIETIQLDKRFYSHISLSLPRTLSLYKNTVSTLIMANCSLIHKTQSLPFFRNDSYVYKIAFSFPVFQLNWRKYTVDERSEQRFGKDSIESMLDRANCNLIHKVFPFFLRIINIYVASWF